MSDLPTEWRDQLNIREQIVRIDRAIVEQAKLRAEEKKFNRDPWLLILAACIAAFAAIMARLPELLHAMGGSQ